LYISYGETDEWAHAGFIVRIWMQLKVDAWIKEIWDYVQNDPQYKDKTALVLPTDHGHGDTVKAEWTSHGNKFEGLQEYILQLWDQKIEGKGEIKIESQLYQNQFANNGKNNGLYFEGAPDCKEITGVIK
jgi:hypothetical protein